MGEMKYKVGDRVRIKSLDWYNENKDKDGIVELSTHLFTPGMSQFCGKVMTISDVFEDIDDNGVYYMEEIDYDWTDEMIEGLVEEECDFGDFDLIPKFGEYSDNEPFDIPTMTTEFVKDHGLHCPEGFIFKDENGNIINATKIVLEKKKKEYPKTYEECLEILGFTTLFAPKVEPMFDYDDDIIALQKLKNCRDAYWKIAGEEMGLGKPWKPRWNDNYQKKWIINFYQDEINLTYGPNVHFVLAFPTEEMRDMFY